MLLKRLFRSTLTFNKYKKLCSNFKHKYSTKTATSIDLSEIPLERIRNFSIIAHVDHGKSTLSDRLLEFTGAISHKSGESQVLDKLQVEKERGITVKAQSASILYDYKGEKYLLNFIDTPGHVDFSNEVARSLAACQGVILLVDANDGVQAQTVANFYLAFSKDLVIIPVLNKIDLKNADPERVTNQLNHLFDIEKSQVIKVSAKLGTGITEVFEAIIERLPPPEADRNGKFRALLFDSWYDKYRGVLCLIYIKDGSISIGDYISSCHTEKDYEIRGISVLRPQEVEVNRLVAGQVGLVSCSMRSSKEAFIGDTFCKKGEKVVVLSGFEPPKPMVFAGIYPFDQSQHVHLRNAIEKLVLNDSAVNVSLDTSPALGQGWRLGFLGLLHLEVFCQRLQQEYNAESILTAPSVTYKIKLKPTKKNIKENSQIIFINNPAHFPEQIYIEETYEPMVLGTIITPDKYLGGIMSLCMEKRGIQRHASNIDNDRILLQYDLPLCEIVMDFHDSLKTISSGYATFDYEDMGFKQSAMVKMSIMLNGVQVEELSNIIHVSRAQSMGKRLVLKLKDIIPRQLVQIAIQASVNGKIVGRETLKPYRKDVTAKLYGGDVTRRMKLLAQQAAGKKKMKSIANIQLPRETFIDVLKK
ncbi:translation factor GUF1 homolog, mitochondrial [Onthophagus taurus]|uniref:translation factor GUF1 homolog, mitochondrial n=1 Tax=Onthophagus taurus TaxID=166361 RepID=UPI0039BE3E36